MISFMDWLGNKFGDNNKEASTDEVSGVSVFDEILGNREVEEPVKEAGDVFDSILGSNRKEKSVFDDILGN